MGNGVAAAAVQATASKAKGATQAASGSENDGGLKLFQWLTESNLFKTFILGCIVVNSVMLGYDANLPDANPTHILIEHWNDYFLWIFTAELVLEFFAQGPRRYVRDGWNLFDVIIVATGYMSVIPGITALRALRVLRVFRLVSNVPQMKRVVEALIGAMPGIFATIMVLAVVFYIGAVMATTLFHTEPQFADLGHSTLTLAQLSLFDSWGDTINSMNARYPYAWAFLVPFTVIAAFAVLNLFIGVIVDAVQRTPLSSASEIKKEVQAIEKDVGAIERDVELIERDVSGQVATQQQVLEELRALRAELAALRAARP